MKRIFGLAAIAALALGSFSMAHAQPTGVCGDLGTPVDAACVQHNKDGSTTDCLVWIANGTGTPADGCNQAPAAP